MTKKRFSSIILTASSLFLLSGCPGTGTPTATQGTQTTSIKNTIGSLKSNIQGLKGSITTLTTSLPNVFSSLVSPAHFNAYRTLGTIEGTGITFDDTTRQITKIVDAASNSEYNFAFTGKTNGTFNKNRTATLTIAKSPDNTTGTFFLNVTAENWDPLIDMEYSLPYETWYNQVPRIEAITQAAAKMTLVPQGNQDDKMELEASASELQDFNMSIATSSEDDFNPFAGKMFTKFTLKGYVPKLTFDNTVTLRKAGTSLIEATYGGTLTMNVEGKNETWKVAATLNVDVSKEDANGNLSYTLENTTQGYKLAGTAEPKGKDVVVSAKFLSTSGNTELASVTVDTSKGDTAPKITYADGTSETLAL